MRWIDDGVLSAPCPVCGAAGPKPIRLEVESPFPGRGMRRLLACACSTQFFDDQALPPETYEDNEASVKFYIEQAAGIEHMIWPLLRIPAERGMRFADIGCGFGFALDFAGVTLGWRARGIDRSTAADMGARMLGVDIVPAPFEGPDSFTGETFDLVLAAEVIEHMPDPHGFVQSLAAILAPRGTIILTTPNSRAIRRGQPVGELLRLLAPAFHYVFFTAESLATVLKQAGFSHVYVEEHGDNLKAYAARAELELRPRATVDGSLYRRYLSARTATPDLDVDLRLGLTYRLFKLLVNEGAWAEALEVFAELRAILRRRYGFDLDAPDTISAPEPVPFDLALDPGRASDFFEEFTNRLPCNIVGLLYFRGALALGMGRPGEAIPFLRAAGRVGVVPRSLRLTMAHSDGEIADLFARSFLLCVLALVDVAPAEAVVEIDRIIAGNPPPGVPEPLWQWTGPECAWLLGTAFARLVDRGHRAEADAVFGRLRERFRSAWDFDPAEPESAPASTPLDDGLAGARRLAADASPSVDVPVDLAPIFFARGLLDLHDGRPGEALRYFGKAKELLLPPALQAGAPDANPERVALLARTQVHSILALAVIDPERAVAELRDLLSRDGPAEPWRGVGSDRLAIVGSVFVGLVNRGSGALATSLVTDVELALGVGSDDGPDPDMLAAGSDLALDAAFCRAILALNQERAFDRAARWFHAVYEAACQRVRHGTASASAGALLWIARHHHALALTLADDLAAAAAVLRDMKTPPSGVPSALWHGLGPEPLPILGTVFVRLVNRGSGDLAASLGADVERALGAAGDRAPEPGRLVAAGDLALDTAFCRAMLALNQELAYERAAHWFHAVYEAARMCAQANTASSTARAHLHMARHHEALALAHTEHAEAAIDIARTLTIAPTGIPPASPQDATRDRLAIVGGVFVRLVNSGNTIAARLVSDVESALVVASGRAPAPAHLAEGTDAALDAAFCRAMHALNHEGAPRRAARWFHAVYEAASIRARAGAASGSACALLWIARQHEAIARGRRGDAGAATSIALEIAFASPPDLPPVPESVRAAARALLDPRAGGSS